MIGDNKRLSSLLSNASAKLSELIKKGGGSKVAEKVKLFISLIRHYINGNYRNIPKSSIIKVVAGIIYFIMPLDLIPDFIPITGYIDDLTVLLWIYRTIKVELDEFEKWEKQLKT